MFTCEYKDDGTFESSATIPKVGNVKVTGKWRISDGVLYTQTVKSSHKDVVKENKKYTDRIITLSNKSLITLNDRNQRERWTRVK